VVASLAETSLTSDERALLERFVWELRSALGDELHAVWLFGSRARGEPAGEDSDVDLLVIVDDASWVGTERVHAALEDSARALSLGALTWSVSVHVNTPAWLAQRRAIESFFIAEVDRDKVILTGSG
jgi:predicted nucleotidyltransferase